MQRVSPAARPGFFIRALYSVVAQGNPFRPVRGEQCVCVCVCVLWPTWMLIQSSTVFCPFLVIVILCTGIREAARMVAAASWFHVFACEGVLCGGINGYCVRLEAGLLDN